MKDGCLFTNIMTTFCATLWYIASRNLDSAGHKINVMVILVIILKTLKEIINITVFELDKSGYCIFMNELHYSNTLLQDIDYNECNSIVTNLHRKKDKRADNGEGDLERYAFGTISNTTEPGRSMGM